VRTGPERGVPAVVLAGAALALATAIGLQVFREQVAPVDPQRTEVLYLRSPKAIGRLVLGFDALAADVYWIRAIQYYGGTRLRPDQREKNYELLYPLLDLTTSLDPYFNIAYRFGAIFLAEPQPGGAGRPDQAIALLRKGIAAQPNRWEYFHDIAFTHYWSLGDYQAAAEWFRRAAAIPKSPEWLLPIAASMLAEGKDRASARYLWTQLLTHEEDWVRKRAQRALVQLDALDRIDALAAEIAKHPRPPGPYSWTSLARAGVFPGIPTDPTGTPYAIDPVTGTITVARNSPLWPIPRGLRR
jgi:tetratricopeptide (TPR) repeat protein